jgi:hypothetical protein
MTTLLHKITIWCGIGFMVTSLALFMMSGSRPASSGSVVEELQQEGAATPDMAVPPLQGDGLTPIPDVGDETGDGGAGAAQPDQTEGGTEGGTPPDQPQGGNQ